MTLPRYLLGSFSQQQGHTITLLGSDNLGNFTALGSSYNYVNNGEVVRDAWMYDDRSTYWMVCGNTDGSIVTTTLSLARSSDLTGWTFVTHIDFSAAMANVNMTYAGKWFLDDWGVPHVIAPVSNDGLNDNGFVLFEVHPLNGQMTSWSTPVPLLGSGLPNNMIDAVIVHKGDYYYLWFKNENTKYCEVARSISPFSGYTMWKSGNWAGWGNQVEAFSLIQSDSIWRIYMERYAAGTGLAFSISSNDWSTWNSLTNITAPFTARSAGIFTRVR